MKRTKLDTMLTAATRNMLRIIRKKPALAALQKEYP